MLVLIGWDQRCCWPGSISQGIGEEFSPMVVSIPEGRRTRKVKAEVGPQRGNLGPRTSRWSGQPGETAAVVSWRRSERYPMAWSCKDPGREMSGSQGY